MKKKIILIGLRSKRYQTQICTFLVKVLSTVLLSLSLKHITRNGEIYCWWLAQLFRPLLKKRVFNQKWKKNTSNNKTRHKSFLESVSISWNQKWFSETTTEWCSCEKKKNPHFCCYNSLMGFAIDFRHLQLSLLKAHDSLEVKWIAKIYGIFVWKFFQFTFSLQLTLVNCTWSGP